MKTYHTDNAPRALGPYSQCVEECGMLYLSGQIALNSKTGEMAPNDIKSQADQCCKNIKAVLISTGLTMKSVVKTTCFLTDMNDFAAFNEVYAKYFTQKPARSCVAVKTLPKNVLCEVEVIAFLG